MSSCRSEAKIGMLTEQRTCIGMPSSAAASVIAVIGGALEGGGSAVSAGSHVVAGGFWSCGQFPETGTTTWLLLGQRTCTAEMTRFGFAAFGSQALIFTVPVPLMQLPLKHA